MSVPTATATPVRYTLTATARETIRDRGVTIAGYVRHWSPDGVWRGDVCGCPDDRCIGYHHDDGEDCGCLPVLLRERGTVT
jgi:hypothetical protein